MLCSLVSPQQRVLLMDATHVKGISFPSVSLSSQAAALLGCHKESLRCFAVEFSKGMIRKMHAMATRTE